MDSNPPQAVHFPEKHCFEIQTQDGTAVLKYTLDESVIAFTHTLVPSALEGQGIGSRLAKAGLEYARASALKVHALCWFVDGYIKRHPEYQNLLA